MVTLVYSCILDVFSGYPGIVLYPGYIFCYYTLIHPCIIDILLVTLVYPCILDIFSGYPGIPLYPGYI